MEDAQALKKASPQARLEIVEGMNHVLKMVPADGTQLASYGDPALPLAPRLVSSVTSFLHTALGRQAFGQPCAPAERPAA